MPVQAEIHSQLKELIVMEPHDLPEQAQTTENSFFLHADNASFNGREDQQSSGYFVVDYFQDIGPKHERCEA